MIHLSYMEAACIAVLLAATFYCAGQVRALFRHKAPVTP